MNTHMPWRALLAALVGAAASRAAAHDFRCEKTACVVQTGAAGLPLLDPAGLPSCAAAPSGALTIDSYPALVAFRVDLTNLVAEPSVVTGVFDPILASSPLTFGASIGPGFALPVGGTGTEVFVVSVASREACLALFGGPQATAPATCSSVVENRFVVEHDVGSAECRARVTCGGAPTLLGRVPPPVCPPTWQGLKLFGPADVLVGANALAMNHLALDPACRVVVAGDATGFSSTVPWWSDVFLLPFDAAGSMGAPSQPAIPNVSYASVAIDAAGNRYVTWMGGEGANLTGHVARLDAAGAPRWDVVVSQQIARIATDLAGNVYVVGTSLTVGGDPGPGIAVVKLSPDGAVLWGRRVTTSDDYGRAIAIGAHGEVLVAGAVSTVPGVTLHPRITTALAKLTPDGVVQWVQFVPGGTPASLDLAAGVGGDAAGNVFVGLTSGYPVADLGAALLTKYDPAGSLLWQVKLADQTRFYDIAVNDAGDVWAVGTTGIWTGAPGTPSALPGQTSSGDLDAFVARFAPDGTLSWATQFGTTLADDARSVAVDALGNAFVTGSLPLTSSEGFVAKFDPAGNRQ